MIRRFILIVSRPIAAFLGCTREVREIDAALARDEM